MELKAKEVLSYVVGDRFPTPIEGIRAIQIFSSLQNCQFRHKRLESLEHLTVALIYIILVLRALRSHFLSLSMLYDFYKASFFVRVCLHLHSVCHPPSSTYHMVNYLILRRI